MHRPTAHEGSRSAAVLRALVASAAAVTLGAAARAADVGDVVAVIVPQPGSTTSPCSIGLAFDGTDLYFDRCGDPRIYRISAADGSLLGSFDTGIPELPNALAFDAKRNGLWIACQGCSALGFGMPIYFHDFGSGTTSLRFAISFDTINPATGEGFVNACFADGLAYRENAPTTDADDELWFSDEENRNVGVFRTNGAFVAGHDAAALDASLADTSGLAIGGRSLYLGNTESGHVFRAALPGFTLADSFASVQGRQADMECDPITFAPVEVLWVRTTPEGTAFPDVITALEIEPGTCGLGGGIDECFVLDFETDDSGAPIEHGARIDTEFDGGAELPVTITSSSGTAAVFDSTTGPAGQDPDLLVGSGNVLILQTDANLGECPPSSGVYCSPNDDEDGGTAHFAFAGPRVPRSIDLVDIDATDRTSSVVLVDEHGLTRTYAVPASWTGDVVADGPPGMGTLDLGTLAPQPGFGSTATASEEAGFDPGAVVQVDVHLGGSGAIDDLRWCMPSLLARTRTRAGSALPRARLTSLSRPRIGSAWTAELDCRAHVSGVATLAVHELALSGVPTVFGDVLIGGRLLQRQSRVFSGDVSAMTCAIPGDVSLCGIEVHAQGMCRGASRASSPTSLRAIAGLSNALDLTFGF